MAPSQLTQDQLRRKFRNRAAESVREAFDEFLRITTVRFWFVNSNDNPRNKHSVKFCPPASCGNCPGKNPYSFIVNSPQPWLTFYVRKPALPSWKRHQGALEDRFHAAPGGDFDAFPNQGTEWTVKIRDVDAVRHLQKLSMATDYPLADGNLHVR